MKLLRMRGKNNPDGSFAWKDAVVDAAISAGLTFFSTLGGISVTQVLTQHTLLAAGIAACTQFFLVLAIKRGIKEKE